MTKRAFWNAVFAVAVTAAMALGPASAAQEKETEIGVTSASNVSAKGIPPVSPERVLAIGVKIVSDERVVTDKQGRAQLLFLDHSALTVGPNSDVVLDRFVYNPDTGVGDLVFSATQGLFRLVGGDISKDTPVIINTPTATFGIRGGIAIVSMPPKRPVEATFLFGRDLTVCSEARPGRERPRPERSHQRCFSDNGNAPDASGRFPATSEHCTCVHATRPGSLVRVVAPGKVADPVIASAEQISAAVEQLERGPDQNGDPAVLVFQQEVEQAVLAALIEPAAGPAPTPPDPTQQIEFIRAVEGIHTTTSDVNDDAGENDPSNIENTSGVTGDSGDDDPQQPPGGQPPTPDDPTLPPDDPTLPPGPPPTAGLSGGYASEPRVINYNFPNFDGQENLARNFLFSDGAITGGRFTATLNGSGVDLPVDQLGDVFEFGSTGTITPFGPVTGLGYVTGDLDFVAYLLQESQTDGNVAALFGGVPMPQGVFPTTGFAAHDIVLKGFDYLPTQQLDGRNQVGGGPTAIPFLTPSAGANIPNAVVSPILSAFHPNLFAFPDGGRSVALQASLAIDGQGAGQQSALSISTFAYFAEADTDGLVTAGGTHGTARMAAEARTRRIASALSSPQDAFGNAFFGDVTTMGFALDSDSFSGLTRQPSVGAEFGHIFAVEGDFTAVDLLAAAVRTDAPAGLGAMRTSQTLNGYAAGIMESLSRRTFQFTDFAFGNANNLPEDVVVRTNATTNRLEAIFNVRNVASQAPVDIYTINFGRLTGSNRARGAFVDDHRFAARDHPDAPGRLGGVDADLTRAGMVTQAVVPADNFLPAGVAFCQCEYLSWGYWNLDLIVNPDPNNPDPTIGLRRDRAHIATWVAGQLPQVDIPTVGQATFAGHLIGNVKNAGNFYVAAGGFQQDWDFAKRAGATTITDFDGASFSGGASATMATPGNIAGTFSDATSGRAGTLNGSFFSGPADATRYLGGQFGITGPTGTDYQASGTFAAGKQ